MISAFAQYRLFLRVFAADWRGQTWVYSLFLGAAMPVGLMWLLSRSVGPAALERRALFFLSGSVVTSLVFSSCSYLVLRLGWARHQRQLDYWASLPVSKIVFVMALLTVGTATSAPGLVSLFALAPRFLGHRVTFTPVGVLVVLLGALALSGVAAIVGMLARDGPQASMLESGLQIVFIFLAPTYVAASDLPAPIRALSQVIPTRYVAEGVRDAFGGTVGGPSIRATAVLVFLAAASFLLARWRLDWRSDGR